MQNENENEILKILSDNLILHIIKLFKDSGKEIDNKEAENVLSKVGLHILSKNKILC